MVENFRQFERSINKDNISYYPYDDYLEVIPKNENELKTIINHSVEKNIKLYPISKGYNWGLGSKIPPTSGCIVLNLKNLNRIIEVDEDFGYALIEPGVTQEDLSVFLKSNKSKYFLDVTGSSKETSVIGNCLERGIAYNTLRVERIKYIEGYTGEGKLIKTGFGRFPNSIVSGQYPYGIGPDLLGLFFQSNFLIVTKAIIKLEKRAESFVNLQISFKSFEHVLNSLYVISNILQSDTANCIFHIANKRRAAETLVPTLKKYLIEKKYGNISNDKCLKIFNSFFKCTWGGYGKISGGKKEVKEKTRKIKKLLSPHAKVMSINVKHLKWVERLAFLFNFISISKAIRSFKPYRMLYFGFPTSLALGSIIEEKTFFTCENLSERVDLKNDNGFLYVLPITLLRKKECREMIDIIKRYAGEYYFDPAITLNPIKPDVIEAVVSITFKKNEAPKAHECIRKIQKKLLDKGHMIYRTNIKDMDLFFEDEDYKKVLQGIKKVFDPIEIISPGRYVQK